MMLRCWAPNTPDRWDKKHGLKGQCHLLFPQAGVLRESWGRLSTCGGLGARPQRAGNRPGRRLPIGAQDAIRPHNLFRCSTLGRLTGATKLVVAVLVLALCAGPLRAQSLEALASAYRKNPRPAARATLLRYASAHPKDVNGALALLATGVTELEQQQYADALPHLKAAAERLPRLDDYTAYFIAQAEFGLGNEPAAQSLAAVWDQNPKSPLISRGALLAAQGFVRANEPRKALDLLKEHYADLSQPQGDLMLATAFEAAGDLVSAATYYQRVYYGYPTAAEASQAAGEIAQLQDKLGNSYPPAMPQQMLARALALMDAGQYAKSRQELEKLTPLLGGREREVAQVRIGAADYLANETARAYRYLRDLKVADPEADAERLYYLLACARRMDNQDEVTEGLESLARLYPHSPWRLKALVSAGNHYLLQNQIEQYEPLYRACYESYPDDPQASYCQWKVAWGEYLRRRDDAAGMLRAHLRDYPKSEKATAALYFLGRLAEGEREAGSARAYYEEIDQYYPNSYYAVLARDRLREAAVARAPLSEATGQFLKSIEFPSRARVIDFTPDAITQERIDRGRLLELAGLDDWAVQELRFGARHGAQPQILAMELAKMAAEQDQPDVAIRYIKGLAPDYLYLPLDTAPDAFWRLAFPLPYRQSLDRYSREQSLDPYLVAALVRQESEFNPDAISRAKAYGLTQILPSTGRSINRRLRMRHYSTRMLLRPDANLRMGTYYFRTLLDQMSGEVAATLASYNAGKSRAQAWLNWGEYREPAEFVETIPITETRNYVEMVLRNADLYRRLYGAGGSTAVAERSRDR